MTYIILFLSFVFLLFLIWYLASTVETNRRWVALSLIASLMAICFISLKPTEEAKKSEGMPWPIAIRPGIDIRGGTQFMVELKGKPTPEALDQAVEVLRRRLDRFGVAEAILQPIGANRISVQVPGIAEKEKNGFRSQLERVAKLEFSLVHPQNYQLLGQIERGEEELPFDYVSLPLLNHDSKGNKTVRKILVKKRASMSGKHVTNAFRSAGRMGLPEVIIKFDSEGKKKFGDLTAANEGKQMAIILDGEVYSAPNIREPIYGGSCSISGGSMTPLEAEELASVLENPLDTPVEIVDERGVDPTLGKASIKAGFHAAIIGFCLVMGFMVFYYRRAGLFSALALILNLVILLGLLAQFGATLTLPGVAGIILTIGMAVDANVLIFERIREEINAGKPVRHAIRAGFDKAFSSILDANITTIIAAAILFLQGSGAIQGFAVVLCLGIISSLFAALIITRSCFDWAFHWKPQGKLSMMRFFDKISFDYMGKRMVTFVASAIVTVICASTWYLKGDNAYGVDFAGGDLLTLEFEQKVPDDTLHQAKGVAGATIQYQKSSGATEKDEILTVKAPVDQAEVIQKNLEDAFPNAGFKRLSLDKVKPAIGEEFKTKAAVALALGLVGIFLYITVRFEASFAIGAIVALIHDVIITLGAFTLMGHQFSLTTVGAILTVAGYSINDTIVVFDRIREGLRTDSRTPLAEVMNTCINATLSRTFLTSFTTFIAVFALFIFGGFVIHDFAIMLMVGIFVGTYSSIFIASPLVLLFGAKAKREAARDPSVSPA